MGRQFSVDETVVGVQQLNGRKIFLKHMLKKKFGLLTHGKLQVIPIKTDEFLGWWHLADVIQLQPESQKIVGESLALWISQHSLHLLGKDRGILQTPLLGQLKKFSVRH